MLFSHNEQRFSNRTLGGLNVVYNVSVFKHILPYLYVFMCGTGTGEEKKNSVCNMELKYGGVMDELSWYYDCVKKVKNEKIVNGLYYGKVFSAINSL